jgi:CubicO group peptidase (beta-lactamase class C family)
MAQPTAEQIEKIISEKMEELMKKVPPGSGVSTAFYCPSHPHVKKYYSYGRANDQADMSEHAIICIGSTTKVFTASLISYLHIMDKVGPLDRALVKKHLPDVKSDRMTLLQLATHTSGMPENSPGNQGVYLFKDEPPTAELKEWWSNPSNYDKTFGQWVYSNIAFVTLGYAIEAIANKGAFSAGYSKYLSDWITTQTNPPMAHTWTTVPDNVPAELIATGHAENGDKRRIEDGSDIKSTAHDLHTWIETNFMAMNGPATPFLQALENATSVHLRDLRAPNGKELNFDMGLAWQIFNKDANQPTVISKDGGVSDGGSSSWVGLVPQNEHHNWPQMGLAMCLNSFGTTPGNFGRAALLEIAKLF